MAGEFALSLREPLRRGQTQRDWVIHARTVVIQKFGLRIWSVTR